ncbi:MAG: glycoside hydrolase family 16 protein [Clostridiales bacterium]|jgi:hypothetical protein|nr:glycoside hydrolase family 16 protein [Clostridiales bacterium]
MKKRWTKVLIMVLCFLLFALPLAACTGGGEPPNPDTPDGPVIPDVPDVPDEPEEPEEPLWNKEPVVKSTFYDDFSEGVRTSVWEVSNQKWGAGNHGTAASNVFVSTNASQVAAAGGDGGVVAMRSYGDLQADSSKTRQGSCIITKQAFGPGKYEVRMKPVPRLGQCTAMWTYYDGGGSTIETNKYSEIDIEMPMRGNYRYWSGTSYEYFAGWNILAERGTIEMDEEAGLNDGKWHTYAFEWRTDKANGDSAVIWYRDGEVMARLDEYVPEYTATFWVGNWFPEDLGWVGIPNFEEAYMYVDYVQITQYEDPIKGDYAHGGSGGSATSLGSQPVPKNNYIANGTFKSVTASAANGWTVDEGSITGTAGATPYITLAAGSKIRQNVSGQYKGYSFNLAADVTVTGTGKCYVYAEYMFGSVKLGQSGKIEVGAGDAQALRNILFTIDKTNSSDLRIVVDTDAGTTARVNEVRLLMAYRGEL